MCPLDKLVELRKKYKLRFFLDESLSFGVLGKRGTGLVEQMNVDVSIILFSHLRAALIIYLFYSANGNRFDISRSGMGSGIHWRLLRWQ